MSRATNIIKELPSRRNHVASF